MSHRSAFRLMGQTSRGAIAAAAALAHALAPAHAIIIRDDTDPPEIVDNSNRWQAVGIMASAAADGSGASTCTGSLINPRFFLTAAHCLNSSPETAYGREGTNRLGVSFDPVFGSEGVQNWLTTGQGMVGATDVIYEPSNVEFYEGDLAIVALENPVEGIAYQGLSFATPTAGERVNIVGYGRLGIGSTGALSGDNLRREGANDLGPVYTSWDELGVRPDGLPPLTQPVLVYDFDDPTRNIPLDTFPGSAVANEATTAPGDSGGPLIVNAGTDLPLQVGVLSGGVNPTGSELSTYGDISVYQPLEEFKDWIIDNNPYRYFDARPGNGDWENAAHWTESQEVGFYLKDGEGNFVQIAANDTPEYQPGQDVIVPNNSDGVLIPSIQITSALSVSYDEATNTYSGAVDQLVSELQAQQLPNGTIGMLLANEGVLTDIELETALQGLGTPQDLIDYYTSPSYDGSFSGFTNTSAANLETTRTAARYYDVLLGAAGATTLSTRNFEVDRLRINNDDARLQINSGGELTTWLDTAVETGELNVNGSFRSRARLLNMGGVVSGDGIISTDAGFYAMAGTVSPGNSIGTLSITGDYIQGDDATLLAEVGASTADLLEISGQAMLDGELILAPDGSFIPTSGRALTLLTSSGLIPDGSDPTSPYFDTITNNLGTDAGVFYTSTDVVVTLGVDFQSDLETAVQQAVAGGLTGLGAALAEADLAAGDSSMTQFNALLDDFAPLTDEQKRDAYDSLAPVETLVSTISAQSFSTVLSDHFAGRASAIRAGARGVQTNNLSIAETQIASAAPSTQVMRTAAERALARRPASRMRLPENWGAFIAGDVVFGDADNQAGASDDFVTAGVTVGVDRRIGGKAALGLAGTFASGKVDTASGGEQRDNTAIASLYGSYSDNWFYADGYISFGLGQYETERVIPVATTIRTAEGDADATTFAYGVTFGVTKEIRKLRLSAEASYRASETEIDNYTETGADIYNMTVDERDIRSNVGELALEGDRPFRTRSGEIAPFVRLAAIREFEDEAPLVIARFAAAPNAIIPLAGLAPDEYWGRVGAGLAARSGRLSGVVRFDTDVAREDVTAHQVSGVLRLKF